MVVLYALTLPCARAQAPAGPIVVDSNAPIPKEPATIKVRTLLVNTPVTVRNEKGEMVNNLEEGDFRITDNGVPQKITHFNLGGDPISLVVVVEMSARTAPILPQIRKSGILISQIVMGPTGEGAVVGYDDQVRKLQDFTSSSDEMDKTMSRLQEGSSGSRLFSPAPGSTRTRSRRGTRPSHPSPSGTGYRPHRG